MEGGGTAHPCLSIDKSSIELRSDPTAFNMLLVKMVSWSHCISLENLSETRLQILKIFMKINVKMAELPDEYQGVLSFISENLHRCRYVHGNHYKGSSVHRHWRRMLRRRTRNKL